MTDKEKAIVMAHTGICMLTGDKFQIFHKYVEDIMGRPIMTHEIGWLADTIKEKSKADFMALCAEQEPREDAISRQAVIDIIEKEQFKGDAITEIEKLPHVAPKSETVTEFADRCRECGREKVLDKVRAEIEDRPSCMLSTSSEYERGVNAMIGQALKIIDKYKAESEDKRTSETETWNGIHAQITVPKGTFERIFNSADDDNDFEPQAKSEDKVLDKIRAEIKMYEADCRLQGGTDECEKCNGNVFGSIYRIIDKYKSESEGSMKPTEKQIKYAKYLAQRMCQEMPKDFTKEAYSDFISKWKPAVLEEDKAMNEPDGWQMQYM